jgi:hypothetical protein
MDSRDTGSVRRGPRGHPGTLGDSRLGEHAGRRCSPGTKYEPDTPGILGAAQPGSGAWSATPQRAAYCPGTLRAEVLPADLTVPGPSALEGPSRVTVPGYWDRYPQRAAEAPTTSDGFGVGFRSERPARPRTRAPAANGESSTYRRDVTDRNSHTHHKKPSPITLPGLSGNTPGILGICTAGTLGYWDFCIETPGTIVRLGVSRRYACHVPPQYSRDSGVDTPGILGVDTPGTLGYWALQSP